MNPNEIERERKFLVKKIPSGVSKYSHERIEQGYIAYTPDKVEIRIRKKGRNHTITVKKGGGTQRFEQEIPIAASEFKSLKRLVNGMLIHKTRYSIPYRKHRIELDIYGGKLRGLKTAEVEFRNKREQESFSPPAWFDKEITGNRRYSNRKMAGFRSRKKRGQSKK
jgi:adenylate cyclase